MNVIKDKVENISLEEQTGVEKLKEKAKRYEKSRTFLLIILIFILVTTLLIFVEKVWLNRIGILLSFSAGFLVAPEIIGEKRLKKVETEIRATLLEFSANINERQANIYEKLVFHSEDVIAKIENSRTKILSSENKDERAKLTFKLITSVPSIFLSYISDMFIDWVLIIFGKLFDFFDTHTIYPIAFNENLRGSFIAWGFILFTIGNILQIYSTF